MFFFHLAHGDLTLQNLLHLLKLEELTYPARVGVRVRVCVTVREIQHTSYPFPVQKVTTNRTVDSGDYRYSNQFLLFDF